MILLISAISDKKVRLEVETLYISFSRNCFIEAYNIVRNKETAKDVVQVAFERLILYLENHSFSELSNPKGFLIVMTKREAINFINKAENKKVTPTDTIDDFIIENENEPLMKILRLDQAGNFLKQLEKIKPEYAEIIALKYAKDFTDEEIGVLLDITPANVRMRLTRARRAYEKILNRGDISEH